MISKFYGHYNDLVCDYKFSLVTGQLGPSSTRTVGKSVRKIDTSACGKFGLLDSSACIKDISYRGHLSPLYNSARWTKKARYRDSQLEKIMETRTFLYTILFVYRFQYSPSPGQNPHLYRL
jgi:hypothetical protein